MALLTKSKERKAVINLSVPLTQIFYLDEMCQKTGKSLSKLIQEFIEEHIEADKAKSKKTTEISNIIF